ncbi:hypothetical protein [Streptomyces sp. NPDC051546]|uniref:hypothetical protein n=1 Tax=Streptomyces sp. NPDC051546 TaxID=3365655 RepID=UPI00378C6DDE
MGRPTRSSSSCACAIAAFREPAWRTTASSTFSSTVSRGKRLECWKAAGDPDHHPMPQWGRYEEGTRTTMALDSVTTVVGDLAGYRRRPHHPAGR